MRKKYHKNKQYEKLLSEVSESEHNQQDHSCNLLQKFILLSPVIHFLNKEKNKSR